MTLDLAAQEFRSDSCNIAPQRHISSSYGMPEGIPRYEAELFRKLLLPGAAFLRAVPAVVEGPIPRLGNCGCRLV